MVSQPSGGRGVFGGQTIAQAAWAATLAVRRDEPGTTKGLHSLHVSRALVTLHQTQLLTMSTSLQSYFLSFGSVDNPIIYQVQRLRDGRSYSTRTVLATQLGVPIFTLTCSFALSEPNQPTTTLPIPAWPLTVGGGVGSIQEIPKPEDCLPTEERLQLVLEKKKIPDKLRE